MSAAREDGSNASEGAGVHVATTTHPLRIILVGPGIMPIPPRGWGAVEALIADVADALTAGGHAVSIVNTPTPMDALEELVAAAPHVVHVQYDNHGDFARAVAARLPRTLVLMTSHFGYIDQPARWGGYGSIFTHMTHGMPHNVMHAALSEAATRVLEARGGVPRDHILLTPNGADAAKFAFTPAPRHADRSLCLGKIEPRKRQAVYADVPQLWFAGNIIPDAALRARFAAHPRYLGEWDKPTLYAELTQYGNLVLLSDGEADPLVVKEALICGLGVVVSRVAAANLDVSRAFITVVPDDRLDDIPYVAAAVAANRDVSARARADIRAYGLAHFDWRSVRVPAYVAAVRTALATLV